MNNDLMFGVTPWLWFGFSAVLGIVVWGFLIWFGWVLATSVKGIREELAAIRRVLDARSD